MAAIRKAGALIIEERRLLIVKPKDKPFFINPGGKYEREETPKQCLERELQEELGISLRRFEYYGEYGLARAAHSTLPLHLELYLVWCEGVPRPASEIEQLAWMSREDYHAGTYIVAPSFDVFVPDLLRDRLL